MATRMPFPDDVNPDPDATYSRGMAEAFPHDPHLSAAPRRLPIPNRPSLWVIAALIALVALAMTGCSVAEAQEPSANPSEILRWAAELKACPGQAALWIDESTVQCLNYLP